MKQLLHSTYLFLLVGFMFGAGQIQPLAAQNIDVWVDFTSDFHDGENGRPNGVADWIDELNQATMDTDASFVFTDAERATIESNVVEQLATIFSDYNINFIISEPDFGDFDVLYMARDNDNPAVGASNLGSAPIDLGNFFTRSYSSRNGNPPGVSRITTGNFGGFIETSESREQQVAELSAALASIAAHEFGHSLGLLHHFAYSDLGISPSNYSDTGDLQNQYTMATGATGVRESGLEMVRALAPFSKVMLDITGGAESPFISSKNFSVVDSPIFSDRTEKGVFDAGSSIDDAYQLVFGVGESSGNDISFIEADLDNSAADVDVFSFSVDSANTAVLSAHVFSERLSLGSLEFDSALELLDSSGNVLFSNDDFFYNGNVVGNNGQRDEDPFLLNINLDSGDYFLRVSAADRNIGNSASSGDQYWLVTSLSLTSVLLGDVNLDGVVDFLDITPFISVLFSGRLQAEADIDQNGNVDLQDISPFIAILSGSSS